MRIAFIGQRGVPATWGGVERHVEELGARLAARGHHVTVWCRSAYGDGRARHRGMHLRYAPAVDQKHLEASTHAGISTVAALADRPDVVHYHAIGPGLFSPVARASGAKVVQTIHGFDQQRAKWGRGAAALLQVAAACSEHAPHAVIGVSRQLADHYRDRGVRSMHIPNGVDRPQAVDRDRVRAFGVEPGRYVLFVGRLVPEKCPDVLVEAFAGLDTTHRLVVAGGSSHTDEFAAAVGARGARDPRVVLPGYVYGDDLAALYANAAAFVLPSSLEGLPLTLLEAAAHGVPTIASNIAPHREVLGTSGGPGRQLVPPGDVHALRDALRDTLAEPGSSHLGASELRNEVLTRFCWDEAAARTEALYRHLLDDGPMPAFEPPVDTPAHPVRRDAARVSVPG